VKGREILQKYNVPFNLNTVILVDEEHGRVYGKSGAMFMILKDL
jgi:hypothetical protein